VIVVNISEMGISGSAVLPLHWGRAPHWLIDRMIRLCRPIVRLIIAEYGRRGLLARLSDPYWFQALGCVLGYDWHSSGVTTTVTGVLRTVLDPVEFGVAVCGGKGRRSRLTPQEVEHVGIIFGLSGSKIEGLKLASKMSAKVDSVALQDGYKIYHHVMVVSEDGDWAVIQQGMNTRLRLARRYHWLSLKYGSWVENPDRDVAAVMKHRKVLNMTDENADECRKVSTDIARMNPRRVQRLFRRAKMLAVKGPFKYVGEEELPFLNMPERLNWRAIEEAYQLQPGNFEDLIKIEGLGPSTVRGLALISDLIYGEPPSWRDPAKYALAFGGKDGVPFPVDVRSMEKAISFMEDAIRQVKIGGVEKEKAVNRLKRLRERLYSGVRPL